MAKIELTDEGSCVIDENRARVVLMIRGDALVPEDVSAATGLAPRRAWKKGLVLTWQSGAIARLEFGLWAVEATGTCVEAVASDLLRVVEPHIATIRGCAVRAGACLSVGISWDPDGGYGGFSVSSETLSRLVGLGDVIEFYFPDSLGYMDLGLGPTVPSSNL